MLYLDQIRDVYRKTGPFKVIHAEEFIVKESVIYLVQVLETGVA